MDVCHSSARLPLAIPPPTNVNPFALEVLNHLRSSGFRDLASTQLTLDLPLTDEWVNDLLAAWIAYAPGAVRELRVRTLGDTRVEMVIRLTRLSFVPLTVHFHIESQPEIPASPVLVLRWQTLGPAVTALMTRALSLARLPVWMVLAGDRVAINLFALLQQNGLDWLNPLISSVSLTAEPGRLLLHAALKIEAGEPPSAQACGHAETAERAEPAQ